MMKKLVLALFTVFASQAYASNMVDFAYVAPKTYAISDEELVARGLPVPANFDYVRRIVDMQGEHVLEITREETASPSNPYSGRREYIKLKATYFSKVGRGWIQEWTVMDYVDCPGLDIAGNFFHKAITVTDLNKDGLAEVTLPYHLFCGGGVDPHTMKVIMREGVLKYAVRGEADIFQPRGVRPTPGTRVFDKVLDSPELVPYKYHLDKVWKAALESRQPY
jgi:hypothetical protein